MVRAGLPDHANHPRRQILSRPGPEDTTNQQRRGIASHRFGVGPGRSNLPDVEAYQRPPLSTLVPPAAGDPQPDRPAATGPRRPCRGPARFAHRPGSSRPDPQTMVMLHRSRPKACASGRPDRAKRRWRLAFSTRGRLQKPVRFAGIDDSLSWDEWRGGSWGGRWDCSVSRSGSGSCRRRVTIWSGSTRWSTSRRSVRSSSARCRGRTEPGAADRPTTMC